MKNLLTYIVKQLIERSFIVKRAICLILILLFSLLAIGCNAASGAAGDYFAPMDGGLYYGNLDFVWSDEYNGYFVYENTGSDRMDIVIPSTFNGKNVVGIGRHAFGAYSKVRNVIVPDSVIVIESQAFNYCDYLESVTFSKGSSLEILADYAFFNCKSIESISIPASVREIGYRAFSTCPSLFSLTVDVENESYCSQSGDIYTKDMKKLVAVAPAGNAIFDAAPDGDQYPSVYTVPNGVEIIGAGAFADCDDIERVFIPNTVVAIEKAAFAYCDNLVDVIFEEGINLVTIGESAFRECSSLTRMNIPSTLKTLGRYVFYCDNALVEFNYDGTTEQWSEIEKGEKWDVNTGNYVINCIDSVINKE